MFLVQIFTGILLAIYYQPTAGAAYESVQYITEQANYGWFFRSLHKWAATFMIASVILHQIRVFFTGAYRRPRELNWVVGMALLVCTLTTGFTGYSLVFEQLSYWGATVAANLCAAVPLMGDFMKRMLLGGSEYNDHTLARMYILHAAVLPVITGMLVAVHIMFVRLLGVTELQFDDSSESESQSRHFSFFPDHFLTEIMIGLILMLLLSFLATVSPAVMGPRADPLTTPEVIKPEWWFYVSFRWLKLFPLTFAVLSTGFIVVVMFVWPWIDNVLRRVTKREEASVYVGIVAALLLIGLTVWEAVVAH
jgi:quinol-cytochrome oxidoreductase complex cytochrome b subunit